jgi:hypothetical protein
MSVQSEPFDMFSHITKLELDFQTLKEDFHKELDEKINKFKSTIDMDYFLGVEFQRDLTGDFLEDLKVSCNNITITEVSNRNKNTPNGKSENTTITSKESNALFSILNKTSNYANDLKICVDNTYKDKNVNLLKKLNDLFSEYQRTQNINKLSPLYNEQTGGFGIANGPTQVENNYVQLQTNQENPSPTNSKIEKNPFTLLSHLLATKFDKNRPITNEFLASCAENRKQVINICDNQIKYAVSQLDIIDKYIDDVFNSDVGSLFYLMTQLIHYKLGIVEQADNAQAKQSGGRGKKRSQSGGGIISDFITGTAKKYDELPLSKKLFYVEHISIDLLGFMLNKFLVLVGLFEIDITKISNPYEFLKEIEGFVNNVLYDKLQQCITKSKGTEKTLTDVIQETKSWIKITLNIHRMLGLISLILSYVPESQGSQEISQIQKLEDGIKAEIELLGAVKQTLVNKAKLLKSFLSMNGDTKLSDMLTTENGKKILKMSVFKAQTTEEQDVNYDIKCILSQSFNNIATVFQTYANALEGIQFDNGAKMKILTVFQKIGHSYNSRVVRQLFSGLTKGLTKMNKFIDKAQSRILSKLLIGTQAVFLNAMFMYGPLMVNGMLLVIWGCTKGCMLMHKYRKQRQQVKPVDPAVWEQMLIEENDKTNLIDKIKKLVGNNDTLIKQLDIEDSIKNIPAYIEGDVHTSFLNDVKNHDFSVIVDNYTEEESDEINELIDELRNELSNKNVNPNIGNNNCEEFKATAIEMRVPSVLDDEVKNRVIDIYKEASISEHFKRNDSAVASVIVSAHAKNIASAWMKKTKNAKLFDNEAYDDSMSDEMKEINKSNGLEIIQSLQRKPSICAPRLASLLRNRSSIMSRTEIDNVSQRTASIMSMRQPSVLVPRSSSVSTSRSQLEVQKLAQLSEITLRSVVYFKKLQSAGKFQRYNQQQKQSMFLFLSKYNKLQLQQYALQKKINTKNLTTKKELISQIMKYRANRRI